MFNPDNLPINFPQTPLSHLPEPPLEIWQCKRCDADCAGDSDFKLCKSCENAVRRSNDDRDSHFKAEIERVDEIQVRGDFKKQREIQDDLAEDRRRRDDDWQREYSHFSNR